MLPMCVIKKKVIDRWNINMKKTKKAYEIVIDSIKEQIMNQELVLGRNSTREMFQREAWSQQEFRS